MLIFLNGAFGIGKSTVARDVRRQLPKTVIFDPERIGFVLRRLPRWLPLMGRDTQVGVSRGLRLDAVVRSTDQTDLWRAIVGSGGRSEEERYKRIKQNGNSVPGAFHNRELLIILPSIAFGQEECCAWRERDGFEVAH